MANGEQQAAPNPQELYNQTLNQSKQAGQVVNPFEGELANYNPMSGQFVDSPESAKAAQSDFLNPIQGEVAPTQTTETSETKVPKTEQTKTETKTETKAETLPPDIQGQLDAANNAIDQQYESMATVLDQQIGEVDAMAQQQIEAIKKIYAQKKEQMKVINANALGSQKILGARSGRQEFTSEIQQSILSAEESAGVQRLAGLAAEEQSLIAEATFAAKQQSFEILNQRMGLLLQKQQEKKQAILDQWKMAMEYESFVMQKQAFNFDQTQKKLAIMAETGQAPSSEMLNEIDQSLGFESGFAKSFFDAQKMAIDKKEKYDNLDLVSKIIDLQSKIPYGESFSFDGKTYESYASPDATIDIITEKYGNTMNVIKVDKVSGKILEVNATELFGENSKLNDFLPDSTAASIGVPIGTTWGEAIKLNRIPKSMLTGKDKAEYELKLSQNFTKYAEDYKKTKIQAGMMNAALESLEQGGDLNAASQVIVTTFQKILDPTSVVRESEYERLGLGQSFIDQIEAKYQQLTEGGAQIKEENLESFVALANTVTGVYIEDALMNAELIQKQATNYGLNLENILPADTIDLLNGFKLKNAWNDSGIFEEDYDEFVSLYGQDAAQQLLEAQGISLDQDFNQPLSMGENGSLGSLSEKFESGGDPGAIGYDQTGGLSYGAYQLAHNNAKQFIEQSQYAGEFQGIPFNSEAFQQKWKEIAQKDPQGFKQAQKNYIAQTHFEPQVQKLQQEGINLNEYSNVLKDVIWSTAVQHGPGTNIIVNAFKSLKNLFDQKPPEDELIKKIYDLRWSGGQQFKSSTPAVKNSVYNRFFGPGGELAMALSNLE